MLDLSSRLHNSGGNRMKPGWYSQADNPQTAAYFDGEKWGESAEVGSLDEAARSSLLTLPAIPAEPPANAGASADAPSSAEPAKARKAGGGWWWGISAGAVLIIIGIFYGFQPAGSYCSAPFKNSNMAEYMDAYAPEYGYHTDYAGDCVADLSSATTTTWILIGLGILVALVSALIMATLRSGSSRTAAPAVQSFASKIEDLARLRDQGLVTPEEYEWKRQELLRS